MTILDDARRTAVWVGDLVQVGNGRTEWTVTRAVDGRVVAIVSPKGSTRWAVRDELTLIRRCPDGPLLEEWLDGRAYIGTELVLSTRSLGDTVLWWEDAPLVDGGAWPHGVAVSVTTPSPRNGGHRLLSVSAFGHDGDALLPRDEVVTLARSLLRLASDHM